LVKLLLKEIICGAAAFVSQGYQERRIALGRKKYSRVIMVVLFVPFWGRDQ